VDQQATSSPGIQSGATIDSSRLKGSQGVTPFLKVTVWGVVYPLKAKIAHIGKIQLQIS
jgi:hypothetical protein